MPRAKLAWEPGGSGPDPGGTPSQRGGDGKLGDLERVVAMLIACGGTGVAGIGQLADVPERRGRDDGGVEIRIVLDSVEPPAGRLRVLRAPGQNPGPRAGQEIGFSGWLGLLRALYEVTAVSGEGAGPGP